MLEQLTQTMFEAQLNKTFLLDLDGQGHLPLTLTHVKGLGTIQYPSNAPRKEAFSLTFQAPHLPALPQRIYTLHHEELGTIEMIFLVPVAQDKTGRYYEAIFN
jgi:hypothetical protein